VSARPLLVKLMSYLQRACDTEYATMINEHHKTKGVSVVHHPFNLCLIRRIARACHRNSEEEGEELLKDGEMIGD
jgi:hypothetical protein